MRAADSLAVLKVWLFPTASLALGAWMAPLVYNAGKALEEVTSNKTTNSLLEHLASHCHSARFDHFFTTSVVLAAAMLVIPWLDWLRSSNLTISSSLGKPVSPRTCLINLLIMATFPVLFGTFHGSHFTTPPSPISAWLTSCAGACLIECLFRGIAHHACLRIMRPCTAITSCALAFALVFTLLSATDLTPPDPEAATAGFSWLKQSLLRFADIHHLATTLMPLLLLGSLLGHARLKSNSPWLPAAMLTGWIFGNQWITPAMLTLPPSPPIIASLLHSSVMPLATLLCAWALVSRLTPSTHASNPSS